MAIGIDDEPTDWMMARPITPPPPLVVDPVGPPALPLQPPSPIAPMIQSSFFMSPPGVMVRSVHQQSPRHHDDTSARRPPAPYIH
jgi:hypothetical protein